MVVAWLRRGEGERDGAGAPAKAPAYLISIRLVGIIVMRTDHRAAAQSEPVRRRRISPFAQLVYLRTDPLDQHQRLVASAGDCIAHGNHLLCMCVCRQYFICDARARTLVEWLVRRDDAHVREMNQ